MNKREIKNIEEGISSEFDEYMKLQIKIRADHNPDPVTFVIKDEDDLSSND